MRAFVLAIDDLQDAAFRKVRRVKRRVGDGRATCAMLRALTGVRRRAAIGARIEEFEGLEDDGAALWRIPGIRMKSGRSHTVPLSRQAALLVRRRLEEIGEASLLFPKRSKRSYEPMSWCMAWVDRLESGLNAHLGRKARAVANSRP